MIIEGKKVEAAQISLWKANEAGVAFRRVRELLKAEGIEARKCSFKSEWEGRYEIKVPADRVFEARGILFRTLGDVAVQRTSAFDTGAAS